MQMSHEPPSTLSPTFCSQTDAALPVNNNFLPINLPGGCISRAESVELSKAPKSWEWEAFHDA